MGCYSARIFSRRRDLDNLLDDLDRFLEGFASEVKRTRKGRVWQLWTPDGRPFHIDVCATAEIVDQVEEDLLATDLLPEDAPYTIGVCSGCGSQIDWEHVCRLVSEIAKFADGIATEPVR